MDNKEFTINNANNFAKHYSDGNLFSKIGKLASGMGKKAVYEILLLWYVMKSPLTPMRDKTIIIGALGYFILPVDLIPDFIPVLGITDDVTAIGLALKSVSKNITPEIKRQASEKLDEWF